MTPRDVAAVVRYWRDGATSDLRSAGLLLRGRQWLQGLFFCHLAIEKTLKARIVHDGAGHAPHVHNLLYLAGKTRLALDKIQLAFLEEMNRYNIEGRYPSYQAAMRKTLGRMNALPLYRRTTEFVTWCQKGC
ncbi:MAG: HEPN domain-containing protein [Deltaproteobacteria bacterium]|nr:HEPN domain-containing protein [Deltaproteobacteria bacterium]